MSQLILLNKPYQVLCQFSGEGDSCGKRTLADFVPVPDVYASGRLDFDSEGLLLLTDAGWLQHLITHPRFKLPKTYWVQVEGTVGDEALRQLATGVLLKDGPTLPARAERIDAPEVWDRVPPIRFRKNSPTSWLSMTLVEGRKRQIRHMTAAVGLPTLRLIRVAVGPWELGTLKPGQWRTTACPKDTGQFMEWAQPYLAGRPRGRRGSRLYRRGLPRQR